MTLLAIRLRRLVFSEKETQQAGMLPVFRDHDIRPRSHQAIPFPGVDALAADLVAGHSHGHAAGALDLLDLHKAIPKGKQLLAAQAVLAEDALDDHFLGEVLIVVERSVNVLAKVSR